MSTISSNLRQSIIIKPVDNKSILKLENFQNGIEQNKDLSQTIQVGNYYWKIPDDIIGEGQFGTVYLAYGKGEDKTKYAVKQIKRNNDELDKRVIEEMELLNKMTTKIEDWDDALIKFYECFKTDNNYYLIFEYIENSLDIEQLIKEKELQENLILIIFYQLLKGVKFIHQRNIVHRDLKPANVLYLKRNGKIKIIDFGLSKIVENDKSTRQSFVGSLIYMAPELLFDSEHDLFKVDIWSLGIMLYEMIYRVYPWEASDKEKLKTKLQEYNYEKSVLKFFEKVPISKETKIIIQSCLNFDSYERLSAEQLLELEPFKTWEKNEIHPQFKKNFKDVNFEEFLKDFVDNLHAKKLEPQQICLDFDNLEDELNLYSERLANENQLQFEEQGGQISDSDSLSQNSEKQEKVEKQEIQQEKLINTENIDEQEQQEQQESKNLSSQQEKQQKEKQVIDSLREILGQGIENYVEIFLYLLEQRKVYRLIEKQIQDNLDFKEIDISIISTVEYLLLKILNYMAYILLNLEEHISFGLSLPFFYNIIYNHLKKELQQDGQEKKDSEQDSQFIEEFWKKNKQNIIQFLNESEIYFKSVKIIQKSKEIINQEIIQIKDVIDEFDLPVLQNIVKENQIKKPNFIKAQEQIIDLLVQDVEQIYELDNVNNINTQIFEIPTENLDENQQNLNDNQKNIVTEENQENQQKLDEKDENEKTNQNKVYCKLVTELY